MENKRPLSILRFNAEKMRDNGAPQEYIAKYLADNGSNFQQIMAVASPSQEVLDKALEMERSGEFAKRKELEAQATAKAEKSKERLKDLEYAQGVARSVGGGLLYGTADEIESAITGQDVDKIRQEQAKFTAEHPVASIGGTVAGAIANPLGAVGMAGKGASLGAKVARGALTSGVQGGLYGLGEGEGGLANRLSNALDYAKTGAVIGGGIPLAVAGVKGISNLGAEVLGLTSGAGGESIKRGFEAGKRNSQTFKQAMRGKIDAFKAVDEAEQAIKSMELSRGREFAKALPKNGNMLLSEKSVLTAYDTALGQISGVKAGVDDVASVALGKVRRLLENVNDLGGLTFNNALEVKTAIDDIIAPLNRAGEKNAVRILKPIQQAVKDTMIDAVPEYGKALRNFAEQSKLIDNIKTALSSGKSPTTELRALQSITRQSVAGAQGGKIQLGKVLDEVSGGRLLDTIAGGQVSQWMPRDALRGGAGILSALKFDPLGIAGSLALSPRAVGETAFALGRLANQAGKATARIPKSAAVYTPLAKALGGI